MSSNSSSNISIIIIEADSDKSPGTRMNDDENKENIYEKKPPVEGSANLYEIKKRLEGNNIRSEEVEGPIPPVINTLNQGNKENIRKENLTETDHGKKPLGAIPKFRMNNPYNSKGEVAAPILRMRKSLMPCEPDLIPTHLSRIETGSKRFPTNSSEETTTTTTTTTSVPKLLLKEKEHDPKKANLKRTSMTPTPPKPKSIDLEKRQTLLGSPSNKPQPVFAVPSNKSFAVMKQKTSLVPELSQRGLPKKSGTLKTTLNSSAASRRSVRKSLSTSVDAISKLSRKTLLPPPVKPPNSIEAPSKSSNEAKKNPPTDLKKPKQIKSSTPSGSDVFSCNKCPRIFRLSSNLEAHKLMHGPTSGTASVCKFCDKKFAISKALTNHLLEKCTKIPTSERQKLLTNEKSKGGNSTTTPSNKTELLLWNSQSANDIVLKTISPGSKKMQPSTSLAKKGNVPPAPSFKK